MATANPFCYKYFIIENDEKIFQIFTTAMTHVYLPINMNLW